MKLRLAIFASLFSLTASATTLTPWGSLDPQAKNTVPGSLLVIKGIGSDLVYPLEIDPTNGGLPITGSITANNGSVGNTGSAVPSQGTYIGYNVSGNLTGATGTANGLKVDGSGVTQPVSGTFWQATQPVSGTITANAGSGTFAISAASLPLPAGASTAAKQPALGTAGSASADVITVQGIASMTALKVDGSGVTQPISGAVSQTGGPWTQNVTQFGSNNVVTGTGASGVGIPRVTVSNDSVVGLATGANTIGAVTQASGPWTNNVTQFGGSNVATGTGAGGAGIPRVTVSNDSTVGLVAGSAIVGKVGIDQTTPGTTNAVSATNFPSAVDVNVGQAGASTPRYIQAGHDITANILANNNYGSTNVTTGAYVQLISSTVSALSMVCISNSSGSIIKMATGAAASEVDRLYIPGGGSACYQVSIAAGTRISMEALDATASTGYFLFVGLK